jgi:hypothetical protein
MYSDDQMKLKFRASVEWFEKMDIPPESVGYYVVLDVNHNEIIRWKLSKLDMNIVFNNRNLPDLSETEKRVYRTVDEDGLALFVANKLADVFHQADMMR